MFLFIQYLHCLSQIQNFYEPDLYTDTKYIIYFYDSTMECPSCNKYKDLPPSIEDFYIRKIDYSAQEQLSLQFFVFYIPSFVIRADQCTFTIQPKNLEDLIELIKNKEFKKLEWYFEPTMFYMKWFGIIYLKINKAINFVYSWPKEWLLGFYLGVLGCLLYSIGKVIVELMKEDKIKDE